MVADKDGAGGLESEGHHAARTGAPTTTMEREDWNKRYEGKEFLWTVEANRFVAAEVADLPPGNALDLAAGEGRNAVWPAEQGWRVRAVDFSDVAIEKGKRLAAARNAIDSIDFEVADLRNYEPEVHRYHLVVLLYLQLPQAELVPVIQRSARAVAPGGTFLLVGHDTANLTRGHGGPRHPDVLYTAEQVVAALGGELEIEKAGSVDRPVETDEGTKVAIDCLVRAKRA